jgi:hypothetical protein
MLTRNRFSGVDGRERRLVHSGRLSTLLTLLLPLLGFLPGLALADLPDDAIERARLLRQQQQESSPAVVRPEAAAAELPGAKIDVEALRARQELQSRQQQDGLWRRTLGEQQTGKIRQEMTGIPSTGAAVRGQGAERDQRMQDLSNRILQQDLQYKLNR